MKTAAHRHKKDRAVCTVFLALGILVNVAFAFISSKFNIPLFLDTIGTFFVTISGGYFPGVLVAVLTNMMCQGFNHVSIYFSIVNAVIAIVTARFVAKKNIHLIKSLVQLGIYAALISGILGSIIQWRLFGEPQNSFVSDTVSAVSASSGLPPYLIFVVVNIFINLFDKGISLAIAYLILKFLPEKMHTRIKNSVWRQRALTDREKEILRKWSKGNKHSVRTKMTAMLFGMSFLLVLIVFYAGIRIYMDNMVSERKKIASSVAYFASQVIPADSIDEFLEKGEDADGYLETKELLYRIRDNALNVEYLSVVKISEVGMTYIYELDYIYNDELVEGCAPGTYSRKPAYLEDVYEEVKLGNYLDTITIKDAGGVAVISFCPVYNDRGNCVCYVEVDARVRYFTIGVRDYLVRILLMFSGLFFLALTYGVFITGANLVYPINSIVIAVEKFISAGSEQKKMDEALKLIRSLDIETDDEVEKLYFSISDMAANQTEQMRSLRRYTEATSKMQDGLIITMADLVENRDSDTGAHIQKMAAYVKIIVEGLKKKGYYAEKITPQFISDIVRSAPLHDIGKINIPDNVLNKPGKLTPEEYEIMKTHTTAGEAIMAKAISTVEGENYLKEARNMATYHHERWDGTGYPEGLHGEVIPLSARITAVADVFDALTSPRVYKPAFPIEEALAMIQEGAGTQFDPKCVEVFMESVPEVKVILRKYNENM